MIAWRYLRAKRAEGGVSVMTWISLIGITLAVFALIVTLAVRSGFRTELVDTFLGSNAHVTVYSAGALDEQGQMVKGFTDFDATAAKLAIIPGVTQADTVVFASALNDSASVRLRFAPGSELTYNSVVVLNDSVQGVSFRDMTLENTVQGSGNVIMTSPTSSSGTAAGITVTDAPFWYWPPTPIARMSFSPW